MKIINVVSALIVSEGRIFATQRRMMIPVRKEKRRRKDCIRCFIVAYDLICQAVAQRMQGRAAGLKRTGFSNVSEICTLDTL